MAKLQDSVVQAFSSSHSMGALADTSIVSGKLAVDLTTRGSEAVVERFGDDGAHRARERPATRSHRECLYAAGWTLKDRLPREHR